MRRLPALLVLFWSMAAIAQTMWTTSPTLVGTTTPLVITVSAFNETNVILSANTPIKIATPTISDTLAFRINVCENTVGGWTPTYTSVVSSVAIVNRVGAAIQQTGANYCETQNWTFRSRKNQLILETVSPPVGGIPGVTINGTPQGAGQVIVSTSPNAAQWQSSTPGNLPLVPTPPTLLFGSSGTATFGTFAAGSDVTLSSTTPGQVNIQDAKQTCSSSPCSVTGTYVTCTATTPISLLLPPAIAGKPLSIRNIQTSNSNCTLQSNGADTINGASSLVLLPANAVQLKGDASGAWGIISFAYPPAQNLAAHNFATGINGGVISGARPTCSDLTGAAASCGTNAAELSSGTVPSARLPNPLPAANLPAPTASTLGGIKSGGPISHQFVTGVDLAGNILLGPVLSTDLGDLPLSYAVGGTNCTAPGASCINGLGGAAKGTNTDINALLGLTTSLAVSEGGTQCPMPNPKTVAQLLAISSPVAGETCKVSDAQQCQLASALNGGGGLYCPVEYNGTAWVIAGGATAPPGSTVPINQLPTQTATYLANNQHISQVPAPAAAGDPCVEGSPCGAVSPSTGAFTSAKATTFNDSTGAVSSSGLINDNNNSTTIAALNAAGTADIIELGVHADDTIHLGGPNSNGINLDSSAAVSQGSFSSGSYFNIPTTATIWAGGTETCARDWHSYTVTNTAILTLACPSDAAIHDLHYRFYQPTTGSTFTYSIVAGGGAALYTALGGSLPAPCAVNGCYDEIEVTWEPARNAYSARFVESRATVSNSPPPTCGPASTPPCFYFSTSQGNDSTGNGSFATPYKTISKAISLMGSTAVAGTQYLFKGGDLWTGDGPGGLNPPIVLDTTAHELNGTPTNPMIISSYGTGQAIWDGANANAFCLGLIQVTGAGTGNPPVGVTNDNFTINNIKCIHTYAYGVVLDPSVVGSPGASPGMIVSNMTIQDTGFGCSTVNGACAPATPSSNDSDPPDWQAGHNYTANSPSHAAMIMPGGPNGTSCSGQIGTSNTKCFWYAETVASCTSGGSVPAVWNQTVGGTTADNTCSWTTLGTANGGYKNQLQYFASSGGSADGVQFIGNTVKWGGGHNLLEIQGDTGAMRAIQNTVGPGGVHGTMDFKDVGNATTPALAASNTATCGHSLLECGCDNTIGGSTCSTGPTPAIYTSNVINNVTFPTSSHYITFQENVAYDSGIGYQMCPNGVNSGGHGPIVAKYYNNNSYVASTAGIYAGSFGCGNGGLTNSSVDLRNNIFDGGKILVDSGWTAGKMIEDYNDIGGAQGNVTFSVNGGSSKGAHDYCASGCPRGSVTDPSYVNAGASPPNFQLQLGSVAHNAGLTGLTSGNMDMGAY